MDPMIIAAAILAAREIVQAIQANRQLSQDQVAAIIVANYNKIASVIPLIEEEMKRYGKGKP